ncbi:MAG: UDP-N-acetylmuramate--L-alanine ligase [Actinomycetaceae bacterium]|nr:UDP-N-acetylmuramate--L-alanine ligase [Actinomycetaceae bacterium]
MSVVSSLPKQGIDKNVPLYCVGIGGAGMSVIAELLHMQGWRVMGSDRYESDTLKRLRTLGITCNSGHDGHDVPSDAVLVVSSAIPVDNPQVVVALERKQLIIHRSHALMLASAKMDFIAIAGAHGKTTTSAMTAHCLQECGIDASFAVGGIVGGFGTGAYLGSAPYFVAEADESDGSFINYQPSIAVVTNIEADHLDHYGTSEAFFEAFVSFSHRVRDNGVLICCADDRGARMLATKAASVCRVITYGTSTAVTGCEHVHIVHEQSEGEATDITFYDGKEVVELRLSMLGHHNVLNACAAWLVGKLCGGDRNALCAAFSSFEGTGRRFEHRGCVGGVNVIDDYAHHPTELEALMKQARTYVGNGQLHVIFQPHLFSRTRNFAQRFADALSQADDVIVTKIYPAREEPMPGVTGELITSLLPSSVYCEDMYEAGRAMASRAQPGDVILTVGAGDITHVASFIVSDYEGTSRY